MQERFTDLVRVDHATGCHRFIGTHKIGKYGGYGIFGLRGHESPTGKPSTRHAHQIAWVLSGKEAPTRSSGKELSHLTDTICVLGAACCNADHLVAEDHTANMRRSVARTRLGAERARQAKKAKSPRPPRTHCSAGHELTPDNVYLHKEGTTMRRTCKLCVKIIGKIYRNRYIKQMEEIRTDVAAYRDKLRTQALETIAKRRS